MESLAQEMVIRSIKHVGSTLHSYDDKPLHVGQVVKTAFRANAHFTLKFNRGEPVTILEVDVEPGSGWVRVTNGQIEQVVYASDLVVG